MKGLSYNLTTLPTYIFVPIIFEIGRRLEEQEE